MSVVNNGDMVIDLDSTICEVHGHAKQGAGYGYTKCLGYHRLVATRAETGEVLFSRMRKGSAGSSRGIDRFIDELAGILNARPMTRYFGAPRRMHPLRWAPTVIVVPDPVIGF